jgi:peptidyl-prolyl cis-trans isomerase SurA
MKISLKINIKIFLLIFLSINIFFIHVGYSKTIGIVKKINNKIITNVDIEKELRYLRALNPNLNSLSNDNSYKVAEQSLIKEIIKEFEIKKFLKLEDFKIDKLIDEVITSLYLKLNLDNTGDFETYLNNYNIELAEVREKIKIELLWNQLIFSKFENKININEKEILNRIDNEQLQNKNQIKYELSEIIFQAKDKKEYDIKADEIMKSINNIGFKNTANIFSISNTAKLNGYIGFVMESQLSKTIRDALAKIEEKNFTEAINVGGNFIIIYINKKEIIETKIDKKKIMQDIINYEKQRQLENFSQIYYRRLKINTQIDEL